MTTPNKTLTKLATSVMSNLMPAQFTMTLTLVSEDGSWTWSPLDLGGALLHQNFEHHFTDDFVLTFQIPSAIYHQMYLQRQGLKGIVKFIFLDGNGIRQYKVKPTVRTYTVTLVDPQDISRSMVNVNCRVIEDMTTSIKLFEDDAYRVRHESVSGTYLGGRLDDVMGHLANSYGITNLHITQTDNTYTFPHVVIPAYQQFEDVFGYLQERYGVYSQGLASYYTGGALWIYPPYDTNPLFPSQVKIYQMREGAFAGSRSFYTRDDDQVLSFVTTHRSGIVDRSINDSENSGTALMFTRASPEVDGIVSQNSGVLTYNQDTTIVIRRTDPNLTHANKQFTRYAHQTDNIHGLVSHLAERQFVEAVIVWDMAVPYQILPGQLITYYSDHDGKTVSRTGQVSHAIYKISRSANTGRVGGKVSFECQATLTLRLCPTEQVVSNT